MGEVYHRRRTASRVSNPMLSVVGLFEFSERAVLLWSRRIRTENRMMRPANEPLTSRQK
jgi:hypothetical protein